MPYETKVKIHVSCAARESGGGGAGGGGTKTFICMFS